MYTIMTINLYFTVDIHISLLLYRMANNNISYKWGE